MKETKHWCLYSDEEQTDLLACAYEEDQIDFESQYYKEGCWFEYDLEMGEHGSELLLNERKYNKMVIFPAVPFDKLKYGEQEEYNQAWTSMKESMGETEIRS